MRAVLLLGGGAAFAVRGRGEQHLILRIFVNCGLRPGELFALRENDVAPGKLLIDEAVKEKELGAERLGEPKTQGSKACVAISPGLQEEIEIWIEPATSRSHTTRQPRVRIPICFSRTGRQDVPLGQLP